MSDGSIALKSGDRASRESSVSAASLTALLIRHVEDNAAGVALRHKRLGLWRQWRWDDLWREIQAAAIGLEAAGLVAGDTLLIHGGNLPELLFGTFGALVLGAHVAPLPTGLPPEVLAAAVRRLAPTVVLADSESGAAVLADIDTGRKCTVFAVRGSSVATGSPASGPKVRAFADIVAAPAASVEPGRWLNLALRASHVPDLRYVETAAASADAIRVWPLDQRRLVVAAATYATRERLGPRDRALAAKPLWFVPEVTAGLATWLFSGFALHLPESDGTVWADRRAVGPTYWFDRAEGFARLRAEVLERNASSGALRRALVERVIAGESGSRRGPMVTLARRALKDVLGVSDVRVAVATDQELDEATDRFLSGLGIVASPLSRAQAVLGWTSLPSAADGIPGRIIPKPPRELYEGVEELVPGSPFGATV